MRILPVRFLHLVVASLLLVLGTFPRSARANYLVGTGIADITGPVNDITFMGYADFGQTGKGLLQRIYARAFIIGEPEDKSKRFVFVNTDTQSMGDIVKKRVIKRLQGLYGNDIYTEKNVMLSSTHQHNGMGGYLQPTLYSLSVLGWIEETVHPMVEGIVRSIVRAHDKLQNGTVTVARGELLDTNISRSPQAYLLNPAEERARYKYNVDKEMTSLNFLSSSGEGLGLISWFAVHGVSINNTNRLVNGDNKGYAAYTAEKHYNPHALPGKGPFVAAFAQANEGDSSPHTNGAYCTGTDIKCDGTRDHKCPGTSVCYGRGPSWEKGDLESNRIIGQNQADMAIKLFDDKSALPLDGPIDFRQKFWDITTAVVQRENGTNVTLCAPAMGYAFAAGTTDGNGLAGFYQNTTHSNFFWNLISDALKAPSKAQVECQQPKPILLDTGEIKIPYDWQPRIIDVQLVRVGNVYIAAVPSEMTTMSGRRLRKAIKETLIQHGLGNNETVVIQSGPANGYASYCATYEEYQMQRYEGASTPYGPHTLEAYIQVFKELATALATGQPVKHSEVLPDFTTKTFNLARRFGPDLPPVGHGFGDVLEDVGSSTFRRTKEPLSIMATFAAGNPRNNVKLEGTYLTVEQKQSNGTWRVVRTDDDYDTRFHWAYKSQLLGISKATIEWVVDESTPAGTYRLGYFGDHRKALSKQSMPHHGYSSEFTVQ